MREIDEPGSVFGDLREMEVLKTRRLAYLREMEEPGSACDATQIVLVL